MTRSIDSNIHNDTNAEALTYNDANADVLKKSLYCPLPGLFNRLIWHKYERFFNLCRDIEEIMLCQTLKWVEDNGHNGRDV